MKKIFAIILLSLSQSGCLIAAAVDGVTDVTVAVVKAPIKVGGAVVDIASGDERTDQSRLHFIGNDFILYIKVKLYRPTSMCHLLVLLAIIWYY